MFELKGGVQTEVNSGEQFLVDGGWRSRIDGDLLGDRVLDEEGRHGRMIVEFDERGLLPCVKQCGVLEFRKGKRFGVCEMLEKVSGE